MRRFREKRRFGDRRRRYGNPAEPTAEESPYFNNGAVLFRAFLELSGEEFVSLVEEQGFAWYEDDYVMSGFGDSGKSSGFQKNYLADYIQVYNSTTDYRSYEDIKSAGKGDLAKMGVAFKSQTPGKIPTMKKVPAPRSSRTKTARSILCCIRRNSTRTTRRLFRSLSGRMIFLLRILSPERQTA